MFYDNFIKECKKINQPPTFVLIRLGISKGNLSRWKIGGIPGGRTLKKIAEYLHVTVDELLKDGESEFYNNLGFMLREERRHYGFTSEYVAKTLGISHSIYLKYENDLIPLPANIFVEIADIYGMSGPEFLKSYDKNADITDAFNGDTDTFEAYLEARNKDYEIEQNDRHEISNDNFMFSLYEYIKHLSDNDKEKVLDYTRFLYSKNEKDNQ